MLVYWCFPNPVKLDACESYSRLWGGAAETRCIGMKYKWSCGHLHPSFILKEPPILELKNKACLILLSIGQLLEGQTFCIHFISSLIFFSILLSCFSAEENIFDNCINERKPWRKNECFCPKCSVTKGKCWVAIFWKLFVVKETFDKNAFRKRFKKRSEKITTEKS